MKSTKKNFSQLVTGTVLSCLTFAANAAWTPFAEQEYRYDVDGGYENFSGITLSGSYVYLTGSQARGGEHLLVKYDGYGREIWRSSHHVGGGGGLNREIVTDKLGNTYMFITELYSNAHGRLVKFDSDGNSELLLAGEGKTYNDQGEIGVYLNQTEQSLYMHATKYIQKYDLASGATWRVTVDNGSYSWVKGAVVDGSDNVYVMITNNGDTEIHKFDSQGNRLWRTLWGDALKGETPIALGLLPNGGVAVLVHTMYTDEALPAGLTCGSGACNDSSVITLGADGTLLNSVTYNRDVVEDDERPFDLEVGDDGSITFLSQAGVLGNNPTSVYVTRLDQDLNEQWAQSFTNANKFNIDVRDLAVDPLGGVVVSLTENKAMKAVRYSSAGEHMWDYSGPYNNGSGGVFAQFGNTGEVYIYGNTAYPFDGYMVRIGEAPLTCQ